MTSKEAIVDLLRRLHKTTQRLVITTVHARQLRPEAEVANKRQKELIMSKSAQHAGVGHHDSGCNPPIMGLSGELEPYSNCPD